jgi:hypothetical protein
MKKLTSGEQGKIRSSCTKTKFLAGQPQITVNDTELESQLLQASIVTAPFPHDIIGVKALPSDVGNYLITQWSNFATSNNKKKD